MVFLGLEDQEWPGMDWEAEAGRFSPQHLYGLIRWTGHVQDEQETLRRAHWRCFRPIVGYKGSDPL